MRFGPDEWKWADVLGRELWVPLLWALVFGAIMALSLWSAAGCGLLPEQSQETDVDADRGSAVRTEQNQQKGTATAEGSAQNVTAHSYELAEGWQELLTTWGRLLLLGIVGGVLGGMFMLGRMRINLVDMLIAVGITAAFVGAGLGISVYW